MNDSATKFREWMVLELYGHARIAGLVTEATIAGGAFLRVDVPDGEKGFVFSRYYGANAIYSMSPVTESIARAAAASLATPPVHRWDLQLPAGEAAPAVRADADADEFDEDEDEDEDETNP